MLCSGLAPRWKTVPRQCLLTCPIEVLPSAFSDLPDRLVIAFKRTPRLCHCKFQCHFLVVPKGSSVFHQWIIQYRSDSCTASCDLPLSLFIDADIVPSSNTASWDHFRFHQPFVCFIVDEIPSSPVRLVYDEKTTRVNNSLGGRAVVFPSHDGLICGIGA